MEKKSHQQDVKEVFGTFLTDPVKGLSSGEAAARQARDGFNEFEKTKHTTLWQKFLSQFKSFMIIVLIFAAIISGVTGYMHIERKTPLVEITMEGIAYLLNYSMTFLPGYEQTITVTLNTSPDQEKIEISIDGEVDNWD